MVGWKYIVIIFWPLQHKAAGLELMRRKFKWLQWHFTVTRIIIIIITY